MVQDDPSRRKENWITKLSRWLAGGLYVGGLEYAAEEASEAAVSAFNPINPGGAAAPEIEGIEMDTIATDEAVHVVTLENETAFPEYTIESGAAGTSSRVHNEAFYDNPAFEAEPEELEDVLFERPPEATASTRPTTSTPNESRVRFFSRNPRRPMFRRTNGDYAEVEHVMPQRSSRLLIGRRTVNAFRNLRGRMAGANYEELVELSEIEPNEPVEDIDSLFQEEGETNIDEDELWESENTPDFSSRMSDRSAWRAGTAARTRGRGVLRALNKPANRSIGQRAVGYVAGANALARSMRSKDQTTSGGRKPGPKPGPKPKPKPSPTPLPSRRIRKSDFKRMEEELLKKKKTKKRKSKRKVKRLS